MDQKNKILCIIGVLLIELSDESVMTLTSTQSFLLKDPGLFQETINQRYLLTLELGQTLHEYLQSLLIKSAKNSGFITTPPPIGFTSNWLLA